MDRSERFYRIDRLLRCRKVVTSERFLEELEVSAATLKRDLQYLRNRFNAPIVWDRAAGGYRFATPETGPVYELPGFWFSSGELCALLAAHRCLAAIDPGFLDTQVEPLRARIEALLESSGHPPSKFMDRVRLLPMTRRAVESCFFSAVAAALFERKRLEIEAYSRARDEINTRTVSPQRLVHYRDNWYLDAWCHWRKALRSFSVDSIRKVVPSEKPVREIPEELLDSHFAASYGIFAGKVKAWAVLRFSPLRARWVESELWHPHQVRERLNDGGLRLRVPYSDEREILMDILRHGAEVVVEAPESLRERVAEEVRRMAGTYES
ncbi:MAG: YafY family protein [bacterium]|nr:YafY family protein [bacterium]